MTKKEYEKVRQEVSKKYKDEIQELKRENVRLSEMVIEGRKERYELGKQLKEMKSKLDKFSNCDSKLFDLLGMYGDIMKELMK